VLAKAEVDDDSYRRSHGSSMLGGNMFENERRLVMAGSAGHGRGRVRLEVPDDAFVLEALRARAHEGPCRLYPMRIRKF
jgi:hypothetical protein